MDVRQPTADEVLERWRSEDAKDGVILNQIRLFKQRENELLSGLLNVLTDQPTHLPSSDDEQLPVERWLSLSPMRPPLK